MLTLTVADKVLKSVYLDVVAEQINRRTSPFYNMVEKGSEDVAGKEIVSPCRFGINGGIGCTSEDGDLPISSPTSFLQLKAPLINIFGNLEISDKVIRASQGTTGSFVNLLNNELDSLLEAAKFNFGRMLFQDGSGILATVSDHSTSTTTLFAVDKVKHLMEGMVIDFVDSTGAVLSAGNKIVLIDRQKKTVKVSKAAEDIEVGTYLVLQGSYKNELYGLPYMFNNDITTLYGNSRIALNYLLPVEYEVENLSCDSMQQTLDNIEEKCGTIPNLMLMSYDIRRKYLSHLQSSRMNFDYMYLDGGFKTMSYNGIPMYADQFVDDNTMFLINSEDYKLQQLGDWSWLEGEGGRILRQMDNKPAYGATLVKYANLICTRPIAQSKLTIKEAVVPETEE